jgi:hypothetical protein
MLSGDDEVRGLEHRLHAQREQAVEIDRAQRVVRPDRRRFLQDHRAFVEAVGRAEDRQAGLRVAARDRPVDRRRAAIFRQQRRVKLDRAALRYGDEILRRELQHERHDADLDVEVLERALRLVALQRSKLEHLDALFLRRDFERIGPASGLLGRAENACDLIAARKERLRARLCRNPAGR